MVEFALIKNGIPYAEIKEMTDTEVYEFLIIIEELNVFQSDQINLRR